ncbi:hypothetical protein Saga11_18850 [Bacillus safensis]|nr:hypothetical protein Saga11_18850 [Bacillus safensis]
MVGELICPPINFQGTFQNAKRFLFRVFLLHEDKHICCHVDGSMPESIALLIPNVPISFPLGEAIKKLGS